MRLAPAVLDVHYTTADSGEPADELLQWKVRAWAAEIERDRARQQTRDAEKLATFYAGCALLFFWSGVVIAVIVAVT